MTDVIQSEASDAVTHGQFAQVESIDQRWLAGEVVQSVREGEWDVKLSGILTPALKSTDVWRSPRLEFYKDGKLVHTYETQEMIERPDRAELLFTELIAQNSTPELVWMYYTGGAHCCAQVVVHYQSQGEWLAVEVGHFDGMGPDIEDIDGDGQQEFIAHEDRFLYKFSSYACSYSPRKVLGFNNGVIEDLSRDDRYRRVHEDMQRRLGTLASRQVCGNGFWPAYVVTAAYLGEGRQAWEEMLEQYDPHVTDGLQRCAVPDTPYYKCDDELLFSIEYPQALKHELEQMGVWELINIPVEVASE